MNRNLNDADKYGLDAESVQSLGPVRAAVAVLGDQIEQIAKAQAELAYVIRPVTATMPSRDTTAQMVPVVDGATCELHEQLLVLVERTTQIHQDARDLAQAIRI